MKYENRHSTGYFRTPINQISSSEIASFRLSRNLHRFADAVELYICTSRHRLRRYDYRRPSAMLPYVEHGEIDYASLEYNPNEPEPMPDPMEQEFVVREIIGIMHSRFTDFMHRPDVSLSSDTTLCYDPANLNVRRQPDIYLAFGVDQAAIRRRKLYLPWEAGKSPDPALED